jgi:hypothetical protein
MWDSNTAAPCVKEKNKGTQFEKSQHRSENDNRNIQNIGEEVSQKLL